jgi:hypothetical protein
MMAARRGKHVFSFFAFIEYLSKNKSQSPTVYKKPLMKTNLIAAESAANDDDDDKNDNDDDDDADADAADDDKNDDE